MNNQEIKTMLESILAKINDNEVSAWNSDLEDTTSAIATEDHFGEPDTDEPSTIYNGWYQDIESLISKL
jgi:hypothetical protein